jgi:putative intracellular protease/amidase
VIRRDFGTRGKGQIDLTGPFEVFSRLSNSTYRIVAKTTGPMRDVNGLRLTADAALTDAPQLDVLHVPGGLPGASASPYRPLLSLRFKQVRALV